MRPEEKKQVPFFLSKKSKNKILNELVLYRDNPSEVKPWYDDNGIDSRYPLGQVVSYSTGEYRMRIYPYVMYVVKGYETNNPIFTREAYSNPGEQQHWSSFGILVHWSPYGPQRRMDGELRSYAMDQKEIEEFSLKIAQSRAATCSLKR